MAISPRWLIWRFSLFSVVLLLCAAWVHAEDGRCSSQKENTCPTCACPPNIDCVNEVTIPIVLISPNGSLEYKDTFPKNRNVTSVKLSFPPELVGRLSLCSGQQGYAPPVLGTSFEPMETTMHDFDPPTDFFYVAFNINGGGYWDACQCPYNAYLVSVYLNTATSSYKVTERGVVSPDVNPDPVYGSVCELTGNLREAASCALSDAVELTGPIGISTYAWWADMNGDGSVGLTDAVLVTAPLALAHMCPLLPP